MKRIGIAAVAVVLLACNPPEQRQPEAHAPSSDPSKVSGVSSGCRRVADLFDELVRGKSEGMTEDQALALLSDRGDYMLGYVVDGVFGNRYGASGSPAARADVIASCRAQAKGEPLY